ncbi:MAG: hypothetical protein ABIF19_17115 [Planctomycetota bacterium]|uniref:Uncharacterized protein n=1 Tax=viral metagenome TaxID=1070528 RepID=A0A6M3L4W7_9ZZZZ
MHPGAFARESAITQNRIVAAAEQIGKALNIPCEIPALRTQGDLNAIQVSGLNQRRAVADFLDGIVAALVKPPSQPEGDSEPKHAGKRGK